MKLKLALFTCATLVLAAIPIAALSQEDVRGAFLVSRQKDKPATNTNTAPRTSRRRPKQNPSTAKDPKNPSGSTSSTGTVTKTPPPSGSTAKNPTAVNKQRMGLGLTLFRRDSNGNAVRTDPTTVFQKGDSVRVLLETNTDGYIYIFNTTNNGAPVMIYPNAELDEAGNYLQAHVPFEVPSSVGVDERLNEALAADVERRVDFVRPRINDRGIGDGSDRGACHNARRHQCFHNSHRNLLKRL